MKVLGEKHIHSAVGFLFAKPVLVWNIYLHLIWHFTFSKLADLSCFFLISTCSGEKLWRSASHVFYGRQYHMLFMSLSQQCQFLLETHSANTSQWPGLNYSSSTVRLLGDGALIFLYCPPSQIPTIRCLFLHPHPTTCVTRVSSPVALTPSMFTLLYVNK